jgi:hypothetical protein
MEAHGGGVLGQRWVPEGYFLEGSGRPVAFRSLKFPKPAVFIPASFLESRTRREAVSPSLSIRSRTGSAVLSQIALAKRASAQTPAAPLDPRIRLNAYNTQPPPHTAPVLTRAPSHLPIPSCPEETPTLNRSPLSPGPSSPRSP